MSRAPIQTFKINTQSDYSRSLTVLPKGVGSEVFTFEALELSYRYGNKDNHQEHVNEYIEEKKNADQQIKYLKDSG